MQNSENFSIPSSDSFAEAFQRFQQSRQFERLQEKFKVRPFFERARPVKVIADVSGYLLNGFSAATAFAFVFSFLASLLPFKVLAVCFTLAFLVILEGLKRFTVPAVVKTFLQFKRLQFGAIAFTVLLSAGSIASSFFGAKEVIRLLTPDAELIDLAQVRKPFEDRLTLLQEDKRTAEQQTWKGKIVTQAARRLNVIQKQIADQEAAMLQAVTAAEQHNNSTKEAHLTRTSLKAEHFAAVTLLFELLLFLCLWYGEFYDFRSLAEFAQHTASAPGTDGKQTVNSNGQQKLEADVQVFSSNGKHISAQSHTPAVNEGRIVVKGFQPNALRYNAAGKTGTCQNCSGQFEKKVTWQRFCSEACRLDFHAEKHAGTAFDVGKYRRTKQKV